MIVGPRGRPALEPGSRTFPRIAFRRSSRGLEVVTVVCCMPKHQRGGTPSRGNRLVEMTRGAGRGGLKGGDGRLRGILCKQR